MQIGWANHTFVSGGPESGDGIGDLAGSWAYDGVRQQKWHESKADYGKPWKVRVKRLAGACRSTTKHATREGVSSDPHSA